GGGASWKVVSPDLTRNDTSHQQSSVERHEVVRRDAAGALLVVSPDLTRNDTSHQQSSGGVTTDNLMTFDGATLFALAESPVQAGVIWAGSNDGLVHVTRDAGTSWTDVTGN